MTCSSILHIGTATIILAQCRGEALKEEDRMESEPVHTHPTVVAPVLLRRAQVPALDIGTWRMGLQCHSGLTQ